jgi:FixJ family two-component response regulator
MVLHKPTVFVVDDDAPVRKALLRLLRAAGYEAEGLEAPAAYLLHAAPTPPACLVLDVRMPGMSGLELHEKVRGTPHALPTVFITGHSDAEVRRRALALGAVAVLDKPLEKAVLLEAIESALAHWHRGN